MFFYYLVLMISSLLAALSNVWLMRNYQLSAGTAMYSNVLLMVISGIASIIAPATVLYMSDKAIGVTAFSFVMAIGSTLCTALSMISTLKAYDAGQIAITSVFSSMGSIVISCIWGAAFLNEVISIQQFAAIGLIIVAILLITVKSDEKLDKRLLGINILIFLSTGIGNIFTKMHQIEQTYATVDELSFVVWLGIIRVIVFLPFLVTAKKKNGKSLQLPKSAYIYATATSIVGIVCYIMTLIVAAILPISIMSSLSMGSQIGLSAILSWILYKEKLSKREIAGVLLSIVGVFLYT